jgi:hypothetical protein
MFNFNFKQHKSRSSITNLSNLEKFLTTGRGLQLIREPWLPILKNGHVADLFVSLENIAEMRENLLLYC